MEVPRSTALRLCRYNVLGGRVALFVQIIFESLPEPPVILIQLDRIGHVLPISQRHPQRPFRVLQIGVYQVSQFAEALGHTGLILCPVGMVLELFDLARSLVNVQICV